MQRLADYGIVLGVVLVLMLLFRLSRSMLHKFTKKAQESTSGFDSDRALVWGAYFLLSGLLLLPFITSILAFFDNTVLVGGMAFHLVLTCISVILFSFAEDLFRDYNIFAGNNLKSLSWHMKRVLTPLLVFWVVGCLFLSPLFYSGLTILIAVFYRLCLHFRKPASGKS